MALAVLDIELPAAAIEEIRYGYVLLSGYYFLLDSVVDGHLLKTSDALYLTHLLSESMIAFEEASYLVGRRLGDIAITLRRHINSNAAAILLESQTFDSPLTENHPSDYESIVGRSNSSLLLYYVLYELIGIEPDEVLLGILRDFTFYVQLADDFGDWQEDFAGRRWTPFLRFCFSNIGKVGEESDLSTFIFIRGGYEMWVSRIIRGLREIRSRLNQHNASGLDLLSLWIDKKIDSYFTELASVLDVKRSYINLHA